MKHKMEHKIQREQRLAQRLASPTSQGGGNDGPAVTLAPTSVVMEGSSSSKKKEAARKRREKDKKKRGRNKAEKRGKGKRPGSGLMGFISHTLIPRGRAKAHMAARAQQVKDREKLHHEDFEKVKSSLICINVFLFLMSLLAIGGGIYMVFNLPQAGAIALAIAGAGALSLLVTLIGILGAKFESDRFLLLFMSLMVLLILSTVLVGSFAFVLTEQLVRYIALTQLQLDPSVFRIIVYATGGVLLFQVPFQVTSVRRTSKLITTMRAVSNLMETLTMLMFPVGCLAIAGGVFILDSVAVGQSGITALFIFTFGCFVVLLSALGYFGTMIHSRGMLCLFQIPMLLMVCVCLVFGIWAFIQADLVVAELDKNWESIRRFLPTTFEGRYDRVLFREFVQDNLLIMAFSSSYMGIFFLVCAFGAGLMRREIKVEHLTLREAEKREILSMERMEFEAERQQEVKQLEEEAHLGHAEAERIAEEHMRHKLAHGDEWIKKHKNVFHKKWKEAWTKGTKASRCAVRIMCCTVCIVIVVVVACGVTFLVYASFCQDIEAECSSATADPEPSNGVPFSVIEVDSTYTRGKLNIQKSSSSSLTSGGTEPALTVSSCALDSDYISGSLEMDAKTTPGTVSFRTKPLPGAPTYFGVDTSCQQAAMELMLPDKKPEGVDTHLKVRANSVVDLNGESLTLQTADMAGSTAILSMTQLIMQYAASRAGDVEHVALRLNSSMGDIRLGGGECASFDSSVRSHARSTSKICSNYVACTTTSTLFPKPSAQMESVNGFITVENTQLKDCSIYLASKDSAPIMLRNVVAKCSSKYCQLDSVVSLVGSRGSIEATNVIADSVLFRTDQGRIQTKNVFQLNPDGDATFSTKDGLIEIIGIAANGNIQIETSKGEVKLTINKCNGQLGFKGSFQIAYGANQEASSIFQSAVDGDDPATITAYDDETAQEQKSKTVLLNRATAGAQISGTIACHQGSINTCAYANELLITSGGGKVTVIIDEVSDICNV